MANHLFQTLERTFADSGKSLCNFIKADTQAGLPTTGVTEGDLAYCLDTDRVFKWTGATWVELVTVGGTGSDTWREVAAFRPTGSNAADDDFRDGALAGAWVAVDRATNAVTWTERGDVLSVRMPGALAAEISAEVHALMRPISGLTFGNKIVTAVRMVATANAVKAGLIFSNGHTYGAGAQVTVSIQMTTAATIIIAETLYSNFNTGPTTTTFGAGFLGPVIWLRLGWVSANVFSYEMSMDGVTWVPALANLTRTCTPTEGGVFITTAGSNSAAHMASFECFRVE